MSSEEEAPKAEERTTTTERGPWWKAAMAAVGGVAGLAGILALLQAVTGFTIAGPPEKPPTSAPAPNSSPSGQSSESSTPSPSTPIPTSSARQTTGSASAAEPSFVPPDTLASIGVKSELGLTTYGKEVGENLYQMVGGFGHIQVAYGWSGRRADGTELAGTGCQIVVTIAGPQSIPAERYGQCTNLQTSWAKADENSLKITKPGRYEVTVEDEITGVVGTGTFTVLSQ